MWIAKFATMASPALHRISSRCACVGLIIWVDTVGYVRRFTVDPAAEFRGMGDPPEIRLLVGGSIGLDREVLQHRSQHDIHLGDREVGADAPSRPATERQPGRCRRPCAAEAVRIESFWMGEDFRILVKIGDPHEHRAALRNSHVAEVDARRPDPAAGHIDDGAHPQQLDNCGPAERTAPSVDLC